MKNFINSVAIGIVKCAVALIVFALVWLLFVILPVAFHTEAKCLEDGYPRAHLTWDLKQYCSTEMGVVVTRK